MDFILLIFILFLYFNGKRVYAIIGFFALLTQFFMMGSTHDLIFFKHDIQYSAVLFIIIVAVYEINNKEKKFIIEHKVKKYFFFFFLYLLLTGCYDILIRDTSFLDVFKGIKTWCYLLSFFIFSKLSLKELYQILKIICAITLFHVFIYYFQYVTGIIIVETKIIDSYVGNSRSIRFGYPPHYSLLLILVLLSDLFRIKSLYKYFFIALTLGTSILSLTRSMTLSLIIAIILYQSFKNINIIKYTFIGLSIFMLFPIFFSNSIIYERFFEGYNDVIGVYNNFNTLEIQGTFSYRILHLTERLLFISNDFMTSLIGIGYIHEKHFILNPFEYGIFNNEYGKILQLDTADISWSGLFLRYGLLGVILYLLFTSYFMKLFFSSKRYSIAKIGFTYLVINFFFLSFASSGIAFGNFWPIIFLIFFILEKTQLLYMLSNSKPWFEDA